MTRKILLLIFFGFLQTAAWCQLPLLQWAKAFPIANTTAYSTFNNGRSVVVDKQGNVYSTGLFQRSVDFDPGPGVYILTASNQYNTAIFVSKLSPAGDFLWAKQIPIMVDGSEIEIALDDNDNVYITSVMNENADMDPGPGVYMANLLGVKDAFVLKLDTNGDFVWIKQFGGGGANGDTGAAGTAIIIDNEGNIITSGFFNNTVDFDPGPGTFNMTGVHNKGYMVKMTSNGDLIWAKNIGSSPEVYHRAHIRDMKSDADGNIYSTGFFTGDCDFDPGPGVYTLSGGGIDNGFVSKLDKNGNFIFAKHIGTNTSGILWSGSIDLDSYNNIYTTGSFDLTHDFDPGSNVHNVTSIYGFDTYVLKLNNQGEFMWVKTFGGTYDDMGEDLAVDNIGNVYAAGTYSRDVDFDPGPGTTIISNLDLETVLVKLDNNGNFNYAAPFLHMGVSGGNTWTKRVVIDNNQNLYMCGLLLGTVDADPGPTDYPMTGGNGAPYIFKFARCQNITTHSINISTCNSYTLNNHTYTTSGTYIQTITNSSNCDSVITLHLTVNRKFTQQSKTICEGESFFAGGSYQTAAGIYRDTLLTTLGCDSVVTTTLLVNAKPNPDLGPDRKICFTGSAVITPGVFNSYSWQDGSTMPSLNISTSGVYWVKVTNANNCTATDTLHVISVDTLPRNFLPADRLMCLGSSMRITVPGYKSYTWSTGNTSNYILITDYDTYSLSVTDNNNCVGSDTIVVQRDPNCIPISIPNSFTPDNNGTNDIFKPVITQDVFDYSFIIFNRYGQKVFETNDHTKGWDGTWKGMNQPMNSYVYYIRFKPRTGFVSENTGTVLLLR